MERLWQDLAADALRQAWLVDVDDFPSAPFQALTDSAPGHPFIDLICRCGNNVISDVVAVVSMRRHRLPTRCRGKRRNVLLIRKRIAPILGLLGLVCAGAMISAPAQAATPRAALVVGSYKPDASTTGVPSGTALTKVGSYDKPYVITVDGTVLDGKEIFGDVKVQAKNVVIKNSLLHCGNYKPSTNTGCIDANSANVFNLTVQDSTIHPIMPSPLRDGIVGHEYNAMRNHVYGTNDGMGVFNKPGGSVNANVRIEGNYIHTTVYHDAAHDPGPSADGTHNDGIQVQGGTNIRIAGNTIVNDGVLGSGSTADPAKPRLFPHGHGCTIILQNNTGAPLKNTVVEQNWFDDGLASACIKPGEITFQKNRFGQNQYNYFAPPRVSKYVVRIDVKARTIVHGLETNVWASTGQPLKVGKGLGIEYDS